MTKETKIIGIISVKGGVGKTTVVSNLGAALATKFNKRVLLVDGNMTAPNLGLHLGVLESESTLHDVIYDNAPLEKAITKSKYGFDVLTSSLVPKKTQQKRLNPYKLHNRLSQIKKEYDVILIDSSPNLSDEMLSTMIAADELLVVTSPDYPTLSCTMHAIKVAKERKTPIAGLILNKVRNKRFELSVHDIENTTGVPVLSVINDNVKVLEALAKTAPATIHAPKKDFAISYRTLAAKVLGEEYKDPRLMSKVLRVFKKS
ncbi:AAA family ATPase [Candidatus Woesearchaeota archaeon]|jgi:septum site-determining protein MinD|nr:AAA family ATPase [Candidatus Woesearchaeota archaeon]